MNITDSQQQGPTSSAPSYTLDADLSGPEGRIARYTVTGFPPSGSDAILNSQAADGWTRVTSYFGPKTSNLQGTVRRATTAIFESIDPPASLPLVVSASIDCVFASNLTLIDPS